MVKIFFFFFLLVRLQGDDYVVITNKALHVNSIIPLEVKMIFLKKNKILHDTTIIPINLGVSNDARKSFEKNLLHMSRRRLQHYWIQQHYLGKRPPITMRSPKSIIKFVRNVDGAIAYIPTVYLDDSVKVLLHWND